MFLDGGVPYRQESARQDRVCYKVCQDLCALLTFPVTPGALLTTETGMI